MRCRIVGQPPPKLKWEHNGHPIEYSETIFWTQFGDVCELRFAEVNKENEGEYFCIAENKFGQTHTHGWLSIGGADAAPAPPHFVKCLYDLKSKIGSAARFTCQIVGQPLPEITWFKDGELIRESKNLEVNFLQVFGEGREEGRGRGGGRRQRGRREREEGRERRG